MTKIIDLSVYLEAESREPAPPKIAYVLHRPGAALFCRKFPFMGKKSVADKLKVLLNMPSSKKALRPESFPDGEFLSNELVTATTHTGTHLDAPWHYGSRCEGRKARTVAEIPLISCYGDGVVLNMSHKAAGSAIEVKDIQKCLDDMHYNLKQGDIVLIRTDFDKKWGTQEYFTSHPGMSREATEYLIDRGIQTMGINAYGFDRPFGHMVADYIRTGDPDHLWPSHFLGRKKEYYHLERLANLDALLQPCGFKVVCFPIKIKESGAAWVRAVAILEDGKGGETHGKDS